MKPSPAGGSDVLAALDELFGAIDKYRTSKGFQELLEFLKRLPTVGPYNGLLLHIQRPGVTDVATVRGWMQLGREVKREANPLVTLKAFGPVEFVYDILDTTGPDLPPDVSDPFRTSGQLSSLILERTALHAESDRISIREVEFGAQLAGRVSGQRTGREVALLSTGAQAALVVELNKTIALEARYATLVHELGHVYCGHLGVPPGAWWPDRKALKIRPREFEAEAVAWIVCSRQGLDPGSYRYLEGYLGTNILGAIAEFERARIAERVKAGLQRARAQGKRLGRPRQAPRRHCRPWRLRARGCACLECVQVNRGEVDRLGAKGENEPFRLGGMIRLFTISQSEPPSGRRPAPAHQRDARSPVCVASLP